jgi:plastocyanin
MVDVAERADVRASARWTRLGILGQLFVAAGVTLMLLAVVTFGLDMEGETTFFLIVIVISLAGAALAWRLAWGKILGIVTAILTGMAVFWTAFGLEAFPSFFDFMPGILVLPGALLAIVSYIAAIVAGRRGHSTVRAEGGERTAIRVALGIVAVLAVVTGALTLFGRSTVDATQADETVVMSDFEFDEGSYRFPAGTKVLVRNDDPFMHTFTVENLDIDETLLAGDEVLVTIPARPGAYVLYCRPHTETPDDPEYDSDMAARLRVG